MTTRISPLVDSWTMKGEYWSVIIRELLMMSAHKNNENYNPMSFDEFTFIMIFNENLQDYFLIDK